jgi:hypothetical protein
MYGAVRIALVVFVATFHSRRIERFSDSFKQVLKVVGIADKAFGSKVQGLIGYSIGGKIACHEYIDFRIDLEQFYEALLATGAGCKLPETVESLPGATFCEKLPPAPRMTSGLQTERPLQA